MIVLVVPIEVSLIYKLIALVLVLWLLMTRPIQDILYHPGDFLPAEAFPLHILAHELVELLLRHYHVLEQLGAVVVVGGVVEGELEDFVVYYLI